MVWDSFKDGIGVMTQDPRRDISVGGSGSEDPTRIIPYSPYSRTKQSIQRIRRPEAGVERLGVTPSPGGVAEQVASLETEVSRLRQVEGALLESNDSLALLSETANELLSSERPQEVINTLFEKLSARLGLEVYFNYLVDGEKGKLHLNAYAGIPAETAREIEWLEYGQAVCGCVARDGSRIVAEDIQHSGDIRADLVRSFGITAYACHPILAQGRVIGTFSFGTSKKPQFESHELALMQAVCDQVSMAMERILLISELRRREASQSFLAEAAVLLSSFLDYGVTLGGFAKLAVQRIADWCVVDAEDAEGHLQRFAAVSPNLSDRAGVADGLEQGHLMAPEEMQSLRRVMATGQPEIYRDLSDGEMVAFSGSSRQRRILEERAAKSAMIVPLSGRNGAVGAITFVTTESGRRYDERDLELAKELARRASIAMENARLYREAQQAVQLRNEFLSVAAHELKTPITSLRGFSQAVIRQFEIEHRIDERRVHRAFQVIDQQSEKLTRLVSQLLDLSRIDAGRLSLEREELELGELVRGVVEAVQGASPHWDVALHIHEPIWIAGDAVRLGQVLRSLLDNAIRYSPGGGKIDVDVWSPVIGQAKLAVRDRGVGIPLEHRDKLFGRFHQAHSSDHVSGLGLGLHLSKHIVELHEGTIEAEFPPDGGTRFVVTLPTALAELKQHGQGGQEEKSESTGHR